MYEPLNDDQWQQIEDHLYSGRKIEAIKLMRQWTGVDLTDAKDMIDQCEQELRAQKPDRFAKPKAGGCATAGCIIVLFSRLLLPYFCRFMGNSGLLCRQRFGNRAQLLTGLPTQ